MGDLFDEVMGVLNDVDGTAGHQQCMPDLHHEQLSLEFHRNPTISKARLDAQINKEHKLQEMDDFGMNSNELFS